MSDEQQPDQAEEAARAAAGSPEPPEPAEPGRGADPQPVGPAAGPAGHLPAISPAKPAFRSPRAQSGPEEARPTARLQEQAQAAGDRPCRPLGQAVNRYRRLQWLRSRSSSRAAAAGAAAAACPPDTCADAEGAADQPAEPLRAAGRGVQHGRVSKATMMPLERRNEPQMLRSFWKQYPSYRVQPLLYKRYNELLEARAFNEWLENRRIRKEGEEYTDAVGRLTETVNRRLPQLRYAPAERSGIRRAARDIAGPQHPGVGGCGCSKESMEERRLVRLPSAPQTMARCWATSRRGSPSLWSCPSAMPRSTWPPTSTSTTSRSLPRR